MSARCINVDSMIRGAFTRAEREILETCPAFTRELQTVNTIEEFEVLCLIGHEFLLEKLGLDERGARTFAVTSCQFTPLS